MSLKHHSGTGLIIGGALIAMLFFAFIFAVPHTGPTDTAPLWLGAIWALLAVVWGMFRFVAGPSKLDHLHGGTGADSH